MTGTQSNYDNATSEQILADTKKIIPQQRGSTRSWRNIMFKNHKKVSTVTGSTSTTKKKDDFEIKTFHKKKNCRKESWDKCKSAIGKKLKVIAKEMEILHQTQPQYSTGPLWSAVNPVVYGYHGY